MARDDLFDLDGKDKAGYNQAARITETLAILRNSYVSSMIEEDYRSSLKISRRVLDIISAKLEKDEIEDADKKIQEIKKLIPKCEETFINNGKSYYKDPNIRDNVEVKMEKLWRQIEKLQDEHGYGMLAEEDIGL